MNNNYRSNEDHTHSFSPVTDHEGKGPSSEVLINNKALSLSEERFRTLVTASSDVVYSMSPDWSEMYQLHGRDFITDRDSPNYTWIDKYVHPADKLRVMKIINETIQNKSIFELEHRVLQADGSIGWAFSRAVPLLDEKGEIKEWFGAARDITEQKQAETALKESGERFRVAQKISPDGFTILHPVRDEKGTVVDFTWVYENAAIAQISGTDPQKVTGKRLLDIFPSHLGTPIFEAYIHVATTGESRILEEASYLGESIQTLTWFRLVIVPMDEEIAVLAQDITKRKQAEEALRESEEKYRDLFDSIDEGFCIIEMLFDDDVRPVDYRFLEVNPAFESQTGLKDAIGRRVRDMLPGHEQHWFDIYGRVAITGKPVRFQCPADALGRFYDVYAFRVGEPWQRRVAVLFNDITKRKQTEEALRESETLFRSVQENTIDRFTILKPFYNDAGDIIDFTYVYQNSRAAKTARYRPEELVGLRMTVVWTAFTQTRFFSIYKQAVETNRAVEFEERYCSDGVDDWFHVTATPVPEGIAVASQIITERKKAEEALRESEARFRSVLDNSIDGIYRMSAQTGRFEYVSPSAEAITGYTCMQYMAMNSEEALAGIHPDDLPTMRAALVQLNKTGKAEAIYRQRTKSGEYRWISNYMSLTSDKAGRSLYRNGSIRDITKLKQAEETLNKSNEILKKDVEMKDEFLSLVSHEFKTPLTVINSAVQAMRLICRDELSDKSNQYLGRILQNSNRQLKLVNNLLDITRINAGNIKKNLKNIDIILLTRTITESIAIFAEQRGIRLSFSSTLREKIIGIDEEKYERIMLNLLSNAIKFTPRNKSIFVRTSQKVVKGKCKLCIQVKDQGIGIPQDKRQLIFERFGQVDSSLSRQAEGTGIGLSLVKMFVELMNGEIAVESELGKGSTFTVLFPVTKIKETPIEKMLQEINDHRLIQSTAIEFSDIY